MITPERFTELTGYNLNQQSYKLPEFSTLRITYIKHLSQSLKPIEIVEFTGLKLHQIYQYINSDKLNKNFLSLLNEMKSAKKVSLAEACVILRNRNKHLLWDKIFKTWNQNDFNEIERLKNYGKA